MSDGKVLGGKNRLKTKAVIDKLQAYYGAAIRRNLHRVVDMKKHIIGYLFSWVLYGRRL